MDMYLSRSADNCSPTLFVMSFLEVFDVFTFKIKEKLTICQTFWDEEKDKFEI